jgi:hypothetical protein
MKRLILGTAIILLMVTGAIAQTRTWTIQPTIPDYSRPYGEAGSVSNPYRATERSDGTIIIKSTVPDFDAPLFQPGQPLNPIIIRPTR